jgi:hypothetical protein
LNKEKFQQDKEKQQEMPLRTASKNTSTPVLKCSVTVTFSKELTVH